MTSKLFLLLLIASATIVKSRWSLIELEDKDDHGEAEKDGNEKDLRVESERLAKYQNHGKKNQGKDHGNNHGKNHGKDHGKDTGKNHGNHGKKDGKAGAGDDYAIFGGLNRVFRSPYMQW